MAFAAVNVEKNVVLEGLEVQSAVWVCDKKVVVLLGLVLSREVVAQGLTHTDETTRGSGPREQEVRKYVPSAGKGGMEKAKMSNES